MPSKPSMRIVRLSLAAVMLVALLDQVVSDPQADKTAWELYKTAHKKRYQTDDEEQMRFGTYLMNKKLIERLNKDLVATGKSYRLEANKYTDWTPQEYRKLLGYRPESPSGKSSPDSATVYYTQTIATSDLPATVNLTAEGYVNPVENQEQCGDCWAFSACGALEGQYFKVTGKSAVLSEQNLLDCSTNNGNMGCSGGYITSAFMYVTNNKGIDTNSSYPYTEVQSTCQYNPANNMGYNTGYEQVEPGSEGALQQAVAKIGPISVGINAHLPSFQFYEGGVYSSPYCSPYEIDHAVLVVGYGTYNGIPYWLIKNSWGTDWGMNGYMMMARNEGNMCGILSQAFFPTGFTPVDN